MDLLLFFEIPCFCLEFYVIGCLFYCYLLQFYKWFTDLEAAMKSEVGIGFI